MQPGIAVNRGTVLDGAGDEAGQLAGVVVQRGVAEMTVELMMRVTRQRGWRAWVQWCEQGGGTARGGTA